MLKRLLVMLLIFLLPINAAWAGAESVEAVETPAPEDELSLEGAIVILCTSSTLGQSEDARFDRALLAKRRFNEVGASTILLDAGGALSGTAPGTQNERIISRMNAAGYDAFIPAAIDRCQDETRFSAVQQQADFPVLKSAETVILEQDGLKIGLIGSSDARGDEADILNAAQALGETHCDVIVLIAAHAYTLTALCAAPEISVIIDSALPESAASSDTHICAAERLSCIVLMPGGERACLSMTDEWFAPFEGGTESASPVQE